MKNLLIALGILLVTSCSKVDEPKPPHPITTALVCRTNTLDSFYAIIRLLLGTQPQGLWPGYLMSPLVNIGILNCFQIVL